MQEILQKNKCDWCNKVPEYSFGIVLSNTIVAISSCGEHMQLAKMKQDMVIFWEEIKERDRQTKSIYSGFYKNILKSFYESK